MKQTARATATATAENKETAETLALFQKLEEVVEDLSDNAFIEIIQTVDASAPEKIRVLGNHLTDFQKLENRFRQLEAILSDKTEYCPLCKGKCRLKN